MARFIFKLQGILKIKQKLEEQKEIELGNAIAYYNEQQALLLEMEAQLLGYIKAFGEMNAKHVYPREFIRMNQAIKYYEDEILLQKDKILQAEKAVEHKREALNHAVIERKTYEKLKEIEYENYLQAENLEEAKRLDEITSYKYSN